MSDPLSKEEKAALEARGIHVYDGDIIEEDNRLPLWWQYLLYGSILFSAVFWYGEHQLKAWSSPRERYEQEMVAARIEEAKKSGRALAPEALVALSNAPVTVAQGRELFASTCAACHRIDGGGNIGPNLTDSSWLHGGKPENIWGTVHDGVAAKGMPAWGPQLGDEKVAAVVAYVLTIRETNVANGKAPQGEKEL